MFFSLLFAVDSKNGGFGSLLGLPWKISEDLTYFKKITSKEYKKGKKNVLIMGNNTYKSKPKLSNNKRIEYVLSSQFPDKFINDETIYFNSLKSCLDFCEQNNNDIGKIFVIGGKNVLTEASKDYRCEEILMSVLFIEKIVNYDCYLNYIDIIKDFNFQTTNNIKSKCDINNCNIFIEHRRYNRYNTPEKKYLTLLREVIDTGEYRNDRTGTGTLSIFGPQIEINIENSFPLLTTKKLNFKNIVTEVLWFLSGETNINFLKENGVNIWDGNTTKEFLNKRGLLDYKEGDIGPLYGYQWRNFGGDFKNPESKGIDQIQRMLELLKNEPTSRRIFMSAWNPLDLDKMALEPCHISLQLYISEGKYLDGKLYMRSNDLFLGAPWNIAGYSLLIYMFGHITGYIPRKLIYTLGDAHIYSNHIEQVYEQLNRPLRPFPKLKILDNKIYKTLDDFTIDSFVLEDYFPHSFIKANMAL
jgi:dihydrofolate reductase/thymidylate synthase